MGWMFQGACTWGSSCWSQTCTPSKCFFYLFLFWENFTYPSKYYGFCNHNLKLSKFSVSVFHISTPFNGNWNMCKRFGLRTIVKVVLIFQGTCIKNSLITIMLDDNRFSQLKTFKFNCNTVYICVLVLIMCNMYFYWRLGVSKKQKGQLMRV